MGEDVDRPGGGEHDPGFDRVRIRIGDGIAALEELDDGSEAVGAEDPALPVHDEIVAQPHPHAAEEAGDVRQRRGIEQQEHSAAGLEIGGERVELERQEVALRSRDDHDRRLGRHRTVEQRDVLGGIVLRLERIHQPPEALGFAGGTPLAVPRREDHSAGLPAQRPQDASRELLLRGSEDDDPSALVLDRGAPVLRDAQTPPALGEAVEVVELEVDALVDSAEPCEEVGVLLARPAPEEDRHLEGKRHLPQQLARQRGERQATAGRQIEAAVRALRDELEQPQGEQQENHLQGELRPALDRTRQAHQRSPRQRRESSAKNVKVRNATVKSTR